MEHTPEALQRAIDAGEPVSILDVRNREECEAWAIEGPGVERTQVPYMEFVAAKANGSVGALVDGEDYVVVCAEGVASAEVAESLREAGIPAANLDGGMEAWGRLYDAREFTAGEAAVVQYRRPATGCLAYLVVSGGEAAVVDPLRAFADRYATDAEERGADLRYAIDTHVHADHLSGLRESEATRIMSRQAVDRGVSFPVETVGDGDRLPLGDTDLEIVATPGHTTGMISIRVGNALLCGDTLFVEGVPRPDLEPGADPEAAARELYHTVVDRLGDFVPETRVCPGHYTPGDPPSRDGSYTAALGPLRARIEGFGSAEAFAERVARATGDPPANVERILASNLGTEEIDDDTAFTLELGPNNCAASL
ncbi:MBL fold metallo-hydrolase [Natronomonas sp. EA1]|uniref:MBL fold metallo-hydrolase n=1 Tax=Natronomonas sp. EA1 TaxID=3421655 RepID=UPI003EB8715E